MFSLVVPVYMNAASLPRLLDELERLADRLPGSLEVVFVIDGSPDDSARLLEQRLPSWPVRSQLVELTRNFGSFAAVSAGLASARGEYFGVVAADLQEPPELVVEFLRLMASDEADVVFGYRVRRADPWWSRALSSSFWWLYRRFVVKDMPKGGIDVFGCTREVRDRLLELKELNTNLVALLLWLGFRRAFVPYVRQPRREGRSAWTFPRKLRYALDSVFSFTDLPIQMLLLLGTLGTVSAVAAAVYVYTSWLLGRIGVLGYTPLMLVVTFFGGLTALGLGITGQYLWLTLQNARGRPAFLVARTRPFGPPVSGEAGQPAETSARKSS